MGVWGWLGGMIGPADGLGLADAIGLLRDELLKARAAGAGSDIQLPVESMTVVLKVTATRSVDGKAGFKVPVVELELGGGAGRERGSEQTVTVVFGGPVDRDGRPGQGGAGVGRSVRAELGRGLVVALPVVPLRERVVEVRGRPRNRAGRAVPVWVGFLGWAGGWC